MRIASLTGDDLDGVSEARKYPDETVVRVFCMRTDRLGGPINSTTVRRNRIHRTLDDGTIRRYDNTHEDTKGHELHVAPDPDPETIEFPGMVELWERFWSEIPKSEFEVK